MIKQWQNEITIQLENILQQRVEDPDFRNVLKHSLLPPGKLFRPLLILHLANDLGEITPFHRQFACSIEIHHCYTLIHDDLPAMDNDDFRRGKLSSHKKFNEWTAILAGDSLMNLSFELIADLPEASTILKLYTRYTGANGLILGQITDMQAESENLKQVLKIHELKTSALMQLSLEGCVIISKRPELQESACEIGRIMGINFQLLDDLCEFTEIVEGHELKANPFLRFSQQEILSLLKDHTHKLFDLFEKHKLNNLKQYYLSYQKIVLTKLNNGEKLVNKQIGLSESSWSFLNYQ